MKYLCKIALSFFALSLPVASIAEEVDELSEAEAANVEATHVIKAVFGDYSPSDSLEEVVLVKGNNSGVQRLYGGVQFLDDTISVVLDYAVGDAMKYYVRKAVAASPLMPGWLVDFGGNKAIAALETVGDYDRSAIQKMAIGASFACSKANYALVSTYRAYARKHETYDDPAQSADELSNLEKEFVKVFGKLEWNPGSHSHVGEQATYWETNIAVVAFLARRAIDAEAVSEDDYNDIIVAWENAFLELSRL